jgi:hypothetical protein
MKVTIGQNKYCLWMRVEKHRYVIEWTSVELSYAQRLLKKFLNYYVDTDKIERGKRIKVEIPDELLTKALKLYSAISDYSLSAFKGFREEFNYNIKAETPEQTPEQFLERMKEVVDKYMTIRVLRSM